MAPSSGTLHASSGGALPPPLAAATSLLRPKFLCCLLALAALLLLHAPLTWVREQRLRAPPPPPALPRLLVSILSFQKPNPLAERTDLTVQGNTRTKLETVLRNLTDYQAHFCLRVLIDSNSQALAAHIAASPYAAFASVRVYPPEHMGHGKELSNYHRPLWRELAQAQAHDLFLRVEDDVVVPLASFLFFLERRAELWARGWLFSFVRVEQAGLALEPVFAPGPLTPAARSTEHAGIITDQPVLASPSGQLYAEPWTPYSATYALDREQVLQLAEEDPALWDMGLPVLKDVMPAGMESLSMGFYLRFTGSNRNRHSHWRNRGLMPLTPAGTIDERCVVWNLSSHYSQAIALYGSRMPAGDLLLCGMGSVPALELLRWSQGAPTNVRPLGRVPTECRQADNKMCPPPGAEA